MTSSPRSNCLASPAVVKYLVDDRCPFGIKMELLCQQVGMLDAVAAIAADRMKRKGRIKYRGMFHGAASEDLTTCRVAVHAISWYSSSCIDSAAHHLAMALDAATQSLKITFWHHHEIAIRHIEEARASLIAKKPERRS